MDEKSLGPRVGEEARNQEIEEWKHGHPCGHADEYRQEN